MKKPNYSIDAPSIVFYFGLRGGVGMALGVAIWSYSAFLALPILLMSPVFFIEAFWMLYGSFWSKFSQSFLDALR